MPFNSLGDLSRPISDDDLTKLEELNKLLEEFKTLGPQPPAKKPGSAPSDSTPNERMVDQATPDSGSTWDTGKSPWFDRLMELYRNDSRPIDPDAQRPGDLPGGNTPWKNPLAPGPTAPQGYMPIALKQYTTPGGATYTVDDSVGPQFQKFFDILHAQGSDPKVVQGHNDRNIAGTNIRSKHSSSTGVGAVDIDPDLHPEGASGTWGNIDIRAAAQQAGLRSLADRGGRRGPDEMHVETPGRGPRIETASAQGPRRMDSGRLDPLDQLLGMGGYAGPTSDPESAMGRLKSDPINRAMLLSTALNMMSGSGGGSALQDLGMALGAGVNSGAQTAKSMLDQGNLESADALKMSEGAATRASHENVAQISADSREEVARTRSEAMLQRAAMIHGPQNDKEMRIYADARTKYYTTEKNNQIITRKSDQQILAEADAFAKEQLSGARSSVLMGSQGVGGTGENTSNNAPGAAGSAPPVGTPPTGQPGAQGAPAGKGPSLQELSQDKTIGPTIQKDMQTPEGQAKILSKFPWLKQDIDYYNAGNRSTSGTGLLDRFLGR